MSYTWDKASRRYRDNSTGRYVTDRTVTKWRTTARKSLEGDATAITGRMARGEVTLQHWERVMQDLTRKATISDFLIGIGGEKAWTPADKRAMNDHLRAQYGYLRDFSRQVATGKLPEGTIAMRSRMYVRASNTAYNIAKGRSWGIDLPVQPGEDCEGLTNCRCRWNIKSETTGRGKSKRTLIIAKWELGAAEHCDTCLDHAAKLDRVEFERSAT